jgi:hypothetical protein
MHVWGSFNVKAEHSMRQEVLRSASRRSIPYMFHPEVKFRTEYKAGNGDPLTDPGI